MLAQRYRRRNRRSSSAVSASALAGTMEASRSSPSSLNAAEIIATWIPNVPRNSPSALPKVQLWMPPAVCVVHAFVSVGPHPLNDVLAGPLASSAISLSRARSLLKRHSSFSTNTSMRGSCHEVIPRSSTVEVTVSWHTSNCKVVVAHSAAGWFLPIVAARHRVRRMVFLAAMVPQIGLSFLERLKAEPEMINPAWVGKDPRVEAIADEFLLHDCPPDRLNWGHATIRIVNLRQIMTEPYPLEQWPETPASYIVCAEDRTIRPEWSRIVARSQLKIEPHELPGGHCPYISRPVELVELLLQISEQESQTGHQPRKRM